MQLQQQAIARARRLIGRRSAAPNEAAEVLSMVDRVLPFSMVSVETLVHLAGLVRSVLAEGVPGDLVECGAWRGGASFLMAEMLQRAGARDRRVWLFDSFEGLPPVQAIDGPAALEYTQRTDSSWYFDNCRASLEEVQRAAKQLGVSDVTHMVKGWFEQTLPATRAGIGPIALLRLDCDWYASVRCCLESLYDQVAPGGYIVIDDYYTWDGCAVAVHEFLASRKLPHRIWTAPNVAYLRKT